MHDNSLFGMGYVKIDWKFQVTLPIIPGHNKMCFLMRLFYPIPLTCMLSRYVLLSSGPYSYPEVKKLTNSSNISLSELSNLPSWNKCMAGHLFTFYIALIYFNLKIDSFETKPLIYTYAIFKEPFCFCCGIRTYIGPVHHIKGLNLSRTALSKTTMNLNRQFYDSKRTADSPPSNTSVYRPDDDPICAEWIVSHEKGGVSVIHP